MVKRSTHSKRLVTQIFAESLVPLTIQDVFQQTHVQQLGIAFSTIYRIVQRLKADGLLESLDFKERGGRYEWANRKHHHHLTCNRCGIISDVDDSVLQFNEGYISAKTGFKITHHTIDITGTCSSCNKTL